MFSTWGFRFESQYRLSALHMPHSVLHSGQMLMHAHAYYSQLKKTYPSGNKRNAHAGPLLIPDIIFPKKLDQEPLLPYAKVNQSAMINSSAAQLSSGHHQKKKTHLQSCHERTSKAPAHRPARPGHSRARPGCPPPTRRSQSTTGALARCIRPR
jgi:hypothetical protein